MRNCLISCLHLFLFSLLILLSPAAQASHLRGGEFTYRLDEQNPLLLHGTLRLFQNAKSPIGEHNIELSFGDGSTKDVSFYSQRPAHDQTYVREFTFSHTYPNPGNFRIHFVGRNRNAGIRNFTDSVNETLFIYADIIINPLVGPFHSPQFLSIPVERAEIGVPFHQSLTAYDPNGDSLHYELITPLSFTTGSLAPRNVPGYWVPEGLTIHSQTGLITWASPQEAGEYSLAARIRKFRNGNLVGQVVRDFQIIVSAAPMAPERQVGVLQAPADHQLQARPNEPLSLQVEARDPSAISVELTCFSELLLDSVPENTGTASFTTTNPNNLEVTGTFTLNPSVAQVRSLPYLVTFRALYTYLPPRSLFAEDVVFQVFVGPGTLTAAPLPTYQMARLFPNPVQDYLRIELPHAETGLLEIRSLDGKMVYRHLLSGQETHLQRPATLKAGLYLYSLSTAGAPATQGKLVLQ